MVPGINQDSYNVYVGTMNGKCYKISMNIVKHLNKENVSCLEEIIFDSQTIEVDLFNQGGTWAKPFENKTVIVNDYLSFKDPSSYEEMDMIVLNALNNQSLLREEQFFVYLQKRNMSNLITYQPVSYTHLTLPTILLV